jgi:hypothetical protein
MPKYKILRPALFSDYPIMHMPQEIITKFMDGPCPILVTLFFKRHSSVTTLWLYPDTPYDRNGYTFSIKQQHIKSIPCVSEWLHSYMYLEGDEQQKAKEQSLQWQFVLALYDYSKKNGFSQIINTFWEITAQLQDIIQVLDRSATQQEVADVIENLKTLQSSISQRIAHLLPGPKFIPGQKFTPIDVECLKVSAFVSQYFKPCIDKLYDLNSVHD